MSDKCDCFDTRIERDLYCGICHTRMKEIHFNTVQCSSGHTTDIVKCDCCENVYAKINDSKYIQCAICDKYFCPCHLLDKRDIFICLPCKIDTAKYLRGKLKK